MNSILKNFVSHERSLNIVVVSIIACVCNKLSRDNKPDPSYSLVSCIYATVSVVIVLLVSELTRTYSRYSYCIYFQFNFNLYF
jgi:hypothetical protein